jgi:hypothetical protein
MADTTLIASVTGIVVSGVVGPSATAFASRRAARKQFNRDEAARRRDELRSVLDEAAALLGLGPTRLRQTREAERAHAPLLEELRLWPEQVYVIGQRLRLRLGADDAIVIAFEAVREALVETAELTGDPDEARYEKAVAHFEAAREQLLEAARARLDAVVPDTEEDR